MPFLAAQAITDVTVDLPSIDEVLRVLTFRAGYNSTLVVLGTSMLGLAAGLVGTFAMLRKRALVSDAIAHSGLPGLALAFLLYTALGFQGKNVVVLLFGAACSGVFAAALIQMLISNTRLAEDTAIGAVLSVFFGLGIVLLSVIQSLETGSAGGLHHFIYGQTAAMQESDLQLLLFVASVIVLCVSLLLKELRLVCFDQQFAAVQGWPVAGIDLVLMSLVVLVTVAGMQSVGIILSVALLVIPPTAARFWSERLGVITFLGAGIGALSAYTGAAFSALLPRLPAGAVIVCSAGVFFLISFLFAPSRGVLASALRFFRIRLRVSEEHLLREFYEKKELLPDENSLCVSKLGGLESRSGFWRNLVFFNLQRKGVLGRKADGGFDVTDRGLEVARRVTRNHRLWEEYLLRYGRLATTHVDYSADLVEHVLSPDIVRELERAIAEVQPTAVQPEPLPSLHPLRPESEL